MKNLTTFGIAALDLLLPASCAGCSSRDTCEPRARGLCASCLGDVRQQRPLQWQLGGLHQAFAAAAYDGVVRSALLEYKEGGRLCLRAELANCLVVGVLAAIRSAARTDPYGRLAVLLVPVPSAKATRKARGHHPVRAMARTACAKLQAAGLDVRTCDVLRQTRTVASNQVSTSARATPTSPARSTSRSRRQCAVGPSSSSTTSLPRVRQRSKPCTP